MQPSKHQRVSTAGRIVLSSVLAGLLLAALPACVTKRKVYDSQGVLINEETIVKRPVKDFVDNVQFQ